MSSDKKSPETYKNKKINDFKKDLNVLLDNHDFSGERRQIVEDICLIIAHEQMVGIDTQLELGLNDKKGVTH